MTLATLLSAMLFAGLVLIAAGWAVDLLRSGLRRLADDRRAPDPFAPFDLAAWDRAPLARGSGAPHFDLRPTVARERSHWSR